MLWLVMYYNITVINLQGMDGDNITIYDNDSDESEDDWEDEEQEQETRDDGGDMVEKSLRSYLSRAQLWGSLDEDEVGDVSII